MGSFQLKVQTVWRSELPTDDHGLCNHLVSITRQAVSNRQAPATAVIIRSDRVDLMPLKQVLDAKIQVGRFLAGMSTSSVPEQGYDVEAVGLIGTFKRNAIGPASGVEVAMVFLEWTNCRWWHWHALLNPHQPQVLPATETVACANEGDAKPLRLGGWWSLGRRARMQIALAPVPQVVH